MRAACSCTAGFGSTCAARIAAVTETEIPIAQSLAANRRTRAKTLVLSRRAPGAIPWETGERLTHARYTVWKGYLSFGLVSFPVRLFSAARAETVHFHMLHKKDRSRVKEVWYCVEEDKPIERSDIEKGMRIRKGRYVVVEDGELKKIAPPTATPMEILQFVDSDEVDPIYFEASYYVAAGGQDGQAVCSFPRGADVNKAGRHIAKIAMHNREHIVHSRPIKRRRPVVLHTLYYPGEQHKANRSGNRRKRSIPLKSLSWPRSLVNHLKATVQAAGIQRRVPRECGAPYRAEAKRPEGYGSQAAAKGSCHRPDGSAEAQPGVFVGLVERVRRLRQVQEKNVQTAQGRLRE